MDGNNAGVPYFVNVNDIVLTRKNRLDFVGKSVLAILHKEVELMRIWIHYKDM